MSSRLSGYDGVELVVFPRRHRGIPGKLDVPSPSGFPRVCRWREEKERRNDECRIRMNAFPTRYGITWRTGYSGEKLVILGFLVVYTAVMRGG